MMAAAAPAISSGTPDPALDSASEPDAGVGMGVEVGAGGMVGTARIASVTGCVGGTAGAAIIGANISVSRLDSAIDSVPALS
jgi:hypothetical protein